MLKSFRKFFALNISLLAATFVSCSKSSTSMEEKNVFSLNYGNFEDEINLFDYNQVGDISMGVTMRDGFFYIANSAAGKIMELNSYGDLLTLYYNPDTNPRPSFATKDGETVNATRRAIAYPFNKIGDIAVDKKKNLYVVDTLPVDRQEIDENTGDQLNQVLLHFDGDGNFKQYLGQQGPGGTPFPRIKKIYVTDSQELVVVCNTNVGYNVYWFAENGYMLFTVSFDRGSTIPSAYEEGTEYYAEIGNVVPDYSSRKLYINVDYYIPKFDDASHMQAGINYDKTMLYTLDVESGLYGKPLNILPRKEKSLDEFSDIEYSIPYDFLGVSGSGWYFFITCIDTGFELQMIQNNGQIILNRQIKADHRNTLFYKFDLSDTGVLSELSALSDKVYMNWWRTDSLIQSIIKK